MNRKRTLSILILVFAGLLALYTGISIYQKHSSENIIWIKKLSSLTSISYNNGENLSFVKENGTWYYTSNKEYPIVQSYLKELASQFQNVEAVRELKDGDSLSNYGLDQPSYTIKVKDKNGAQATYYIGNATGENYYFTVDDKSKIYTVSSNILSNLSSSLNDMIETDTFPSLSTGNLTKVVVNNNGKKTTYTSSSKNGLDSIAGGLGVFTFGDCQDYSASGNELSKYGLDAASRISVEISYKDTDTSKKKNLTLYIGKNDKDKKNYYVKLKDSKMVYLSDADVVKNILNPE
ncbi:DUF4340 domain-containing protein [Anaerostipes sp.]|uniref:DUF4340 domain-containing protein n=1 Tax=Anaerostipes sp. TaxID=1872530 RepID=UPI00258A0E83|nr:DUF4340 domain-containing protein [Anaerostipes sp.]MCI5623547.1 DUF4340 domain-containing protein [Anaerostipes sp.]